MHQPPLSKRGEEKSERSGDERTIHGLEAGDVEAAVDEGDFSGDAAGEVAGEEERGASNFELVDVAVEGGAFGYGVEDFAEVADAAGREGLDGPGGDGVDTNVFGAEGRGEVADCGFEAGFGVEVKWIAVKRIPNSVISK